MQKNPAGKANGAAAELLLTIEDLECLQANVQTKVMEQKTIVKSKGPTQQSAEQEHLAVKRTIGELIKGMLGNLDAQDVIPIIQEVYGADFGKNVAEVDPAKLQDQIIRTLAAEIKEIKHGVRTLVVKSSSSGDQSAVSESLSQLKASLQEITGELRKGAAPTKQELDKLDAF